MNDRKYRMKISMNYRQFEFVSTGPKGAIHKVIQFNKTTNDNVYELMLADKQNDGTLDFCAVSNNKDTGIIFNTILDAIYYFTMWHSNVCIYFSGNTPVRTRLYRIIINSFYIKLEKDFKIYGIDNQRNKSVIEPFVPDNQYTSFLISGINFKLHR